jgi:hypothetical protein
MSSVESSSSVNLVNYDMKYKCGMTCLRILICDQTDVCLREFEVTDGNTRLPTSQLGGWHSRCLGGPRFHLGPETGYPD